MEDVQVGPRRSSRTAQAPNIIIPTMTDKRHGNSRDEGVLYTQVERHFESEIFQNSKSKYKKECFRLQHAGAGYSTKQGVLNLNIKEDDPPPRVMTEEESDAHVVGVIFAQHWSMKKGRELFGDRADEAIRKELNQIQDHTTYEPVMKSALTMKQRHEALESLLFITDLYVVWSCIW